MTIIVVFAPSFPPSFRGGGPARTLEALTREAPAEFDVRVVTPDQDLGSPERMAVASNSWSAFDETPTYYASIDKLADLWRMYREVRRLDPDVIYLNSMFHLKFAIVPRILAAVRYIKPRAILVAPRGELDPGALAIRSTKKRAFLRVFRFFRLQRNITWHASAPLERDSIKSVWGTSANILVRENETSLPKTPLESSKHEGPFKAVFISRISEKKGVLTAIEALHGVDSPVELDIYGPEEDLAYVTKCREAARNLPDHCTVRFRGEVAHEDVRATFNRYDAMFFPTAGENFGHVIAESLSASCPVLLNDTTPWTELLREGGGEVVATGSVEEWAKAIAAVASKNPDQRLAFRQTASDAYARWRGKDTTPHVFTMLAEQMQK